jgi:ABC-2 type transport system permease protein
MTSPSDAMPDASPEFQAEAAAPAALPPTRTFFWSVRRELWENSSIWIAPLAAAGVVLFGFIIALVNVSRVPTFEVAKGVQHRMPPEAPYAFAAFVVVVTALITGFFYCLGALNGERRDRSILFWKSLPVSDLTTVLAKAFVPLAILPVVTFVVIVAALAAMLALSGASAALSGSGLGALLTRVPLFSILVILAYSLIVLALWYAPIWGWSLLVGGWARKAGFLWAVGPPLALCVIERVAFGSAHSFALLRSRIGMPVDAFRKAAHGQPQTDLTLLDPIGFVTSPGFLVGLVVGAAFLAAAVWQRRYRGPT